MVKLFVIFIIIFSASVKVDVRHPITSKLLSIDTISNINRGGCGYVAKYVYLYLKQRGYNPSIFEVCNRWHFFVRSNGIYYDSKGSYILPYYPVPLMNEISYDSLNSMLLKQNLWNRSFSRDDTVFISQSIFL